MFTWWFLPEPKERKRKTVFCHECRHVIEASSAQSVKSGHDNTIYFCRLHKKPYDEAISYGWVGMPTAYFKRVQVSAEGVPVGYAKKKKGVA